MEIEALTWQFKAELPIQGPFSSVNREKRDRGVENLNANSTMLEIVMAAFERDGERCVPLHRVYPLVERIFKELDRQKPPGDLKTQVRQTIYLYCPDSPNYIDQGTFFTKCRYGAYQVHRPTSNDLA
jgi:hypothetical protein